MRPVERYCLIEYIDATSIAKRRGDSVSKEAYYTLLVVKADRSREVIGIYNFPTEGAGGWEDVLEELKRRGLAQVDLFVSDSLNGIETAIWKHFPQCEIQLCVVHLQRQFIKPVRPKDKAAVAKDFREVFSPIIHRIAKHR